MRQLTGLDGPPCLPYSGLAPTQQMPVSIINHHWFTGYALDNQDNVIKSEIEFIKKKYNNILVFLFFPSYSKLKIKKKYRIYDHLPRTLDMISSKEIDLY